MGVRSNPIQVGQPLLAVLFRLAGIARDSQESLSYVNPDRKRMDGPTQWA